MGLQQNLWVNKKTGNRPLPFPHVYPFKPCTSLAEIQLNNCFFQPLIWYLQVDAELLYYLNSPFLLDSR